MLLKNIPQNLILCRWSWPYATINLMESEDMKDNIFIQWRYAVVWNACFDHQDHLGFAKHLINVYLFKKVSIDS